MIDFKAIIIGQITEKFKKNGIEVDEFEIIINVTEHSTELLAYFKDDVVFSEKLNKNENSLIKRLLSRRIIKNYSKIDPNFEVLSIFITVDLIQEDYKVFLFSNEKEPKEYSL